MAGRCGSRASRGRAVRSRSPCRRAVPRRMRVGRGMWRRRTGPMHRGGGIWCRRTRGMRRGRRRADEPMMPVGCQSMIGRHPWIGSIGAAGYGAGGALAQVAQGVEDALVGLLVAERLGPEGFADDLFV